MLTCLDNIVLYYPGGWFSMNLACFYSPQELPVMFSFLYTSTSWDCDLHDIFEHFSVSLITVGSVWVKLKLLLFEDPYCDNERPLSRCPRGLLLCIIVPSSSGIQLALRFFLRNCASSIDLQDCTSISHQMQLSAQTHSAHFVLTCSYCIGNIKR